MYPSNNERRNLPSANYRLYVWYGALLFIGAIIIFRLFYLQIIRHDHYRQAALADQLKQYSIAADRGVIKAESASGDVPVVLNEKLYTVYADPTLVKKPAENAQKLASVLGGDPFSYQSKLETKKTRYVVLAKKVTVSQSDALLKAKMPGIGSLAQNYRTYPQGSLASQLLGFVNDDGKGTYGLEQALNKQLAGVPGELKAITDAAGVPLAASPGNVQISPKNGDQVIMSIDLDMQAQLERILAADYKSTKSQGLSAVVMNPNNGQIKAMANFPTYDPGNYQNVTDASLFLNNAVSNAIEPGSTMKNLTTAAALDSGAVSAETTYYDPAHWTVDGFKITNIEEDGGAGTKSLKDILNLSLNTGATWELMQMGGGQINARARNTWHDYLVNHYQFGKATGIEQGYESAGYVPGPDKGYGLDLTYANTSFGQGITMTALQMTAALSAALNGGIYYRPTLVARTVDNTGKVDVKKPVVIKNNVVKPQVSAELQNLMEYVVAQHYNPGGFSYLNFPSIYSVGGKTGTAQIANPKGGYYENKFNGTYAGFVGGDKPQYTVVVFNQQPNVAGYAGSYGGQPVFGDIAHMLINSGYVTPRTH